MDLPTTIQKIDRSIRAGQRRFIKAIDLESAKIRDTQTTTVKGWRIKITSEMTQRAILTRKGNHLECSVGPQDWTKDLVEPIVSALREFFDSQKKTIIYALNHAHDTILRENDLDSTKEEELDQVVKDATMTALKRLE